MTKRLTFGNKLKLKSKVKEADNAKEKPTSYFEGQQKEEKKKTEGFLNFYQR